MNDFWEWRSSSQDYKRIRNRIRRGRNSFIFGALLLLAFIIAFAIFEYAQ
jgi:hypothetical protein